MNRIAVVEPHGDDALISCYKILTLPDTTVHLHTFCDRSSHMLTTEKSLNVTGTHYYDITDLHYDNRLVYNTHDVRKRKLAGEDLYTDYWLKSYGRFIKTPLTEDILFAYRKIAGELRGMCNIYDYIFLPFGLFHPNHYLVRLILDSILGHNNQQWFQDNIIYYVDKPYIEKRYVRDIYECAFNSSIHKHNSAHEFEYTTEDMDNKFNVFKRCYPTETGLFVYSREAVLNDPDIYCVYKSSKAEEFLASLKGGTNET